MDLSERVGELSERTHALAEELSDLAMEVLREAVESSEDRSPAEAVGLEKRLNRARSALEKAARLLGEARLPAQPGN